MKLSLISSKRVSALAALGLLTGLPISAHALTWVGGSGIWNETGGTDWTGGPWSNGSDAIFNTGSGTVVIGSFGTSLDVGTLNFTGAGQYTFDNTVSPINGQGGAGSGTTINLVGGGITGAAVSQVFLNSGDLNFQNSASAGNANIGISSVNQVSFNDTSSGGSATVTNFGQLNLNGNSNTSGLGVLNGGTIDATGHNAPTAGLANLLNLSTTSTPVMNVDFAGTIRPGSNQLQVGNLTLSDADPTVVGNNVFEFALTAENTGSTYTQTPFDAGNLRGVSSPGQGRVMINPLGTFNAPTSFTGTVDIVITAASNIDGGTYTLIDWSNAGVAVNGLGGPNNLADFNLIFGPGVNLSPATHLEIQQGALVLVAVPEPATVAMPLAACLGLLMIRRRASRMAIPA